MFLFSQNALTVVSFVHQNQHICILILVNSPLFAKFVKLILARYDFLVEV